MTDNEQNSGFEFELNKDKKSWSITAYNGESEEVIFPAFHKDMPIKTIGHRVFYQNEKIKLIFIPEGITCIEESAFHGCGRLTEIKLPESLTSIGQQAFEDCIGLMDIKLPESLTTIEDFAFNFCTGLMDIKLPKSLTTIEDWAFNNCTRLTNIILPESLTTIGYNAFSCCSGLSEITVDENNPAFCSHEGVLFDKAMATLLCFPAGKKGKYSVPDGVIRTGSSALEDYESLTGIYFPQSVLSIENSWVNNEQLMEITVNESNPRYCSIDGVLFDKKKSELLRYLPNNEKTEYAVPDGITDIGYMAFSGCKRLVPHEA
jgi:hypothetical protein